MPARRGDCTSVRKRASRSGSSAVRTGAAATARRALKVRSSILVLTLSAEGFRSDRGIPGRPLCAVVRALLLFDERFHPDGVLNQVSVTAYRTGTASGTTHPTDV